MTDYRIDYDTDVAAWSEPQAELLRRRAAGKRVNEAEFDWTNIAAEIHDVGAAERYRLAQRIGTVLEHLVRLSASPAADLRNGWKATIRNARRDMARTLKDSPSLSREVAAMVAEETPGAREDAAASLAGHGETPLVDIAALTFTEDQMIGPGLP
jgi:Domain of unknown function DUF29